MTKKKKIKKKKKKRKKKKKKMYYYEFEVEQSGIKWQKKEMRWSSIANW